MSFMGNYKFGAREIAGKLIFENIEGSIKNNNSNTNNNNDENKNKNILEFFCC